MKSGQPWHLRRPSLFLDPLTRMTKEIMDTNSEKGFGNAKVSKRLRDIRYYLLSCSMYVCRIAELVGKLPSTNLLAVYEGLELPPLASSFFSIVWQ